MCVQIAGTSSEERLGWSLTPRLNSKEAAFVSLRPVDINCPILCSLIIYTKVFHANIWIYDISEPNVFVLGMHYHQ